MGGGTMSWDKVENDREVAAREAADRAYVMQETAKPTQFRPFDKDNLPPENRVCLVRYRPDRPEVKFTEVSRNGSTADRHRVYPALPQYARTPYSRTERMFVGLVLLEPRAKGAADAATYMHGAVIDAFDGWMPCPE